MPNIKRSDRPEKSEPDDLLIVELDERLEFGAVLIDSDLNADDNSGCANLSFCHTNNTGCTNSSSCI